MFGSIRLSNSTTRSSWPRPCVHGKRRLKGHLSGREAPGWTRQDVPFSAYVLALPFGRFTARGTQRRLVQMPDGSLFLEALSALKSETKNGGCPLVYTAKAVPCTGRHEGRYPSHGGPADRLLPLLESADKNIRRAASKVFGG